MEEGNVDPKPAIQLNRAMNAVHEEELADLEQKLAGVAAVK